MFISRFGEFLELKLATDATRLRLFCRGRRLTGIKLSPTGIDFQTRRRLSKFRQEVYLNLGKLWRRRLFSAREGNDQKM